MHPIPPPLKETSNTLKNTVQSVPQPRVDWGDALVVPSFYGRTEEVATLTQWVVEEHCRVVSVLGQGGIGKSALTTSLMHQVAERFEVIIWRSVRDAPTCEALLDECLRVLAPQSLHKASVSLEQRLSLLLDYVRRTRVLLVLDNLETLLEEGQTTGHMRPGYEGYAHLLRRMSETEHQSCLLITSREKPSDLGPIEGSHTAVRALRLAQLDASSCEQLFTEKGVTGNADEQTRLIEAYAGNPLALKIVAQTITDLFNGQIAPFLEQEGVVFGGVRELLDEQYARLSQIEQTILLWLAILWANWRTNNIQALAFAPDGRVLASGGNDATVQLWDAHQGTYLQTLSGQSGAVCALAWSPNGRLLASGGLDGGIRLWKVQGTQPEISVRIFTGHTDWVFALAFAPDGCILASGSFDRTVKLWDVESQRVRETLTGHTNKVRAMAWSPDGHILASCGFDQTILLWDVERGSYRTTLQGHTAAVHDLAFTPEGRILLSGSDDGTLRVWDMASGQCVHILQGYSVSLYDVAWSPDGTQLTSAGSDMLVTIWEVERRTPLRLLRGHRWIVHGLAWSPDGRLLASCGWDNTIQVWDATTGAARQLLRDPDYIDIFFYGVTWSPDGKFLASGSYQRGLYIWEAATGKCQWTTSLTSPSIIRRIEWSPNGTQLASCSDDGRVCLWDASNGRLQASLQDCGSTVKSIAWSSDGARLASGGGNQGNGEIVVWDVHSREQLFVLSEQSGITYALAWDSSGEELISGGGDGTLRWWNVQQGKIVRVREAHQGTVQSLRRSPDGTKLASCGDDGVIRLWELHTGEHLQTLRRDRPYERLNITGIRGVTEAQKATLSMLGAIDEP